MSEGSGCRGCPLPAETQKASGPVRPTKARGTAQPNRRVIQMTIIQSRLDELLAPKLAMIRERTVALEVLEKMIDPSAVTR